LKYRRQQEPNLKMHISYSYIPLRSRLVCKFRTCLLWELNKTQLLHIKMDGISLEMLRYEGLALFCYAGTLMCLSRAERKGEIWTHQHIHI